MSTSVRGVLKRARELAKVVDHDSQPYKSKYDASDNIQTTLRDESNLKGLSRAEISTLQAVRGLLLLDTDLVSEGEQELLRGLQGLEADSQSKTLEGTNLLHAANNALGQLWISRGQLDKALQHLQSAQEIYKATTAAWTAGQDLAVGDITGQTQEELKTDLEAQHTHTLLCLAHTYTETGQRDKVALCCIATLARQLASGDFQRSEWVQNILQLSGFFIDGNSFALAEYCILAAKAVARMGEEAGDPVEEDVGANMLIAEGKIFTCRLQASYRHVLEGVVLEFAYPSPDSFPDLMRFPTLQLPDAKEFLWGSDALVQDFEGVRTLFNKALPLLKKALEFYTMESWVSEHVPLLMDISNLYRMLAAFEPDSHRRCVMHRQRAKLLEGKAEELNPKTYLHFVRSVDMEMANIYRYIYEIKEREQRPDSKVATAAATAATFYERVINSFLTDGTWPAHVQPKEDETIFLQACFSLLRARRACVGLDSRQAEAVERAVMIVDEACEYISRRELSEQFPEASLTQELATLLRNKVKLQSGLSG